jgi:hypothetical protein
VAESDGRDGVHARAGLIRREEAGADKRALLVSGWAVARRIPLWRAGKWAMGRISAWANSVPAAFLPFKKTIFFYF